MTRPVVRRAPVDSSNIFAHLHLLLVHQAYLSPFTPSPLSTAAAAAAGESKELASSVVSRSGGEAVEGGIQLSDSAKVADLQEAIQAKDQCPSCKNRLQEWAQRKNLKLPVYCTKSKGGLHQREFRSIVEVGGERFLSRQWHSRLKDAEQDAAKGAYEILVTIVDADDDDPTDVLRLIDQHVVLCKSVLHEFAVKTKATKPTYCVDRPEGLAPMTLFVSSVSFAGNTYIGEAATNKKDAEQKAARLAVKSILATNNNCMKEIIRSKKQIIVAITSAGFNKKSAVSQENGNAPTNAITTFAPIKFVPAVGAACQTVDQGADPSVQALSGSKKRKKRRTTGQLSPIVT